MGSSRLVGRPGLCHFTLLTLAETDKAVSSIRVALAAIATAYRLAGLALDLRDQKLAPVVEGITRTIGSRPRRQATPAVPDVLRAMRTQCGRDEIFRAALAARNRAMLLLGFGAALRRSELVALTLSDAEIVPGRGLRLLIRRSKTDQQGRGRRSRSGPTWLSRRSARCWR
jgi:integrase